MRRNQLAMACMLVGTATIAAERLSGPYWLGFVLACVATGSFGIMAYLSRSSGLRIMAAVACLLAAIVIVETGYGMIVVGV